MRPAKAKKKIAKGLEEIKDSKQINLTDPDCAIMKSRQGSHASFNVQVGTDDKHGLIVSATTVSEGTDHRQMEDQVLEAEKNLGKQSEVCCADAGYFGTDQLEPLVESSRTVIVPNNEQAQRKQKEPTGYEKDKFKYDPIQDTYTCPKGKILVKGSKAKDSNKIPYRMTSSKTCKQCSAFGICTEAKRGRNVNRLENEHIFEKLKTTYTTEDAQKIYKRRKMKVELQFGHIKRNQGVQSFLLRGLEATKAELSMMSTCFNITRIINILGGVPALINKLEN